MSRGDKIIKVVFTDLDGTMLDAYTGSYSESLNGIELLKEYKIPLVFCSAKTRVEQEFIRENLDINDPFIVENGSAIFIPEDYFSFPTGEKRGEYEVIELGVSYGSIRKEIDRLRDNYDIVGFGHLTSDKVAEITGLTKNLAELAKRREYSETLVKVSDEAVELLKKRFNVVFGGRFIEVLGKNADKGRAVRILIKMFRKEFGEVVTFGIGNSVNDEPMLREVDYAYLVKNPDGSWVDLEELDAERVEGIGPEGWNMAIKEICSEK